MVGNPIGMFTKQKRSTTQAGSPPFLRAKKAKAYNSPF